MNRDERFTAKDAKDAKFKMLVDSALQSPVNVQISIEEILNFLCEPLRPLRFKGVTE